MIFLAIIEVNPAHIAKMVGEYSEWCRSVGKLTYHVEPMIENYWVINSLENWRIPYAQDAIMIQAGDATDNHAIYTNDVVQTEYGALPAMWLKDILQCAKE